MTGSKVVARPGESAELLCQADHPIQECSFYAPEDSQDNTREETLVMIYYFYVSLSQRGFVFIYLAGTGTSFSV